MYSVSYRSPLPSTGTVSISSHDWDHDEAIEPALVLPSHVGPLCAELKYAERHAQGLCLLIAVQLKRCA